MTEDTTKYSPCCETLVRLSPARKSGRRMPRSREVVQKLHSNPVNKMGLKCLAPTPWPASQSRTLQAAPPYPPPHPFHPASGKGPSPLPRLPQWPPPTYLPSKENTNCPPSVDHPPNPPHLPGCHPNTVEALFRARGDQRHPGHMARGSGAQRGQRGPKGHTANLQSSAWGAHTLPPRHSHWEKHSSRRRCSKGAAASAQVP